MKNNATFFSLYTAKLFFMMTLFIASVQDVQAQVIFQKDKNNFITLLDNQKEKKSLGNQHPFILDEQDITAIFSAIEVKKKPDASIPLFSTEQIALLATHLPAAFRQASPQQDIIFALSSKKRYLAGLKTQTFYIAGSIFIQNDQLNILIGDYDKPANKAYEMAYDPTSQGLVKYDFNFGDRQLTEFAFNTPLAFSAAGLTLEADHRYDWVVAPTRLTKINMGAAALHARSTHNDVEDNKALLHLTTTSEESMILVRFRRLEELKSAKLISEQEYAEKRAQLLDEL